jgi:hypothetical protein
VHDALRKGKLSGQPHSDGHELHLAVVLRDALIPRLDEERNAVAGRHFPSDPGMPRAVPGTRGALHCGQDGKNKRTKVRITDRAVFEEHLPQTCPFTAAAGAAKEVHLRARRPKSQVQLQVGITSVMS